MNIEFNKYLRSLLLIFLSVSLVGCKEKEVIVIEDKEEPVTKRLILGDERFDEYLPLLAGKRVAIFSNQSGIVGNVVSVENDTDDLLAFGYDSMGNKVEYGPHLLDVLIEKGTDVTCIFSPEHGFRDLADAGEPVEDSYDEKTGVPIISLYGSSAYPSESAMDSFDVLLADIQDVGVRFYTYYLSLYYLMDACASASKPVIILDRPNPNGFYVDGPLLKQGYESVVGLLPLPVVYGMTLGELALMINKEGWLTAGKDALDLRVISCENYDHRQRRFLIMQPSPNLKDMRAVYLYPSLCFFENTVVSIGRGTDVPFTIFGSPYFASIEEYDFVFRPQSMTGAAYPPYLGENCYGVNLRDVKLADILAKGIDPDYLIRAYNSFHELYPDESFFTEADNYGHYWIDYLSGSDELRKQIMAGQSSEQIKESWQADIEAFKERRNRYLLYP